MKAKTEQSIVTMFRTLSTQHLKRRASHRLQRKEIMPMICARFRYSRSTVYEILKRRRALA